MWQFWGLHVFLRIYVYPLRKPHESCSISSVIYITRQHSIADSPPTPRLSLSPWFSGPPPPPSSGRAPPLGCWCPWLSLVDPWFSNLEKGIIWSSCRWVRGPASCWAVDQSPPNGFHISIWKERKEQHEQIAGIEHGCSSTHFNIQSPAWREFLLPAWGRGSLRRARRSSWFKKIEPTNPTRNSEQQSLLSLGRTIIHIYLYIYNHIYIYIIHRFDCDILQVVALQKKRYPGLGTSHRIWAVPAAGEEKCPGAKQVADFTNHWIGLRENLNRKPCFLPSNIGLSCKFSHHPILWTKQKKLQKEVHQQTW